MNNKYFLSLLFLIGFLLCGCEKQDLLLPSNDLTLKEVRREVEAVDVVRKASFSAEGKILNVILGNISTTEFDDVKRQYSYTEDNLLTCVPGVNSFDYPGCYPYMEYSDGVLTSINGSTLEYVGNTIIEYRELWDGKIIYEFEDDSYNKLIKYEYYHDASSNPTLTTQKIFEYDGDNIIFIEAKSLDDTTGQLETYNTTSYTYDDKINPYKKGHNQIAIVSYYQPMLDLSWEQWNLKFRSTNNVISRTTTYNLTGWTGGTLTYDYTYNDSDYPVTMTYQTPSYEVVTKFLYYD